MDVIHSTNGDIIIHYGVKGMKWGVRHDRRYGARRLRTNAFKEDLKNAARTALVSLPTALPVVGDIYYLYKLMSPSIKESITETKDFEKVDGPIEKLKYIKRGNKESADESFKKVNPNLIGMKAGSQVNCASCSIAMDMRRRGYDVRARLQNEGLYSDEIASFYGKKRMPPIQIPYNTKPQKVFDEVSDILSSQNNGNSSGILCMDWKAGGGHAIYYESKDHEVEFYDGQSGKKGSKIDSYFIYASPSSFTYLRTDNLKPSEDIGKCVVSTKDKRKKG